MTEENPYSLKDKVAIVTGGGSGIGLAISKTFAAAGAKVCVLDVNQENGEKALAAIKEIGDGKFYLSDVSNQQEFIKIALEIVEEFSSIDILVNNAGIAHIGTLTTTSEEDLDRIYSINIKGVYNGMYAVIPQMQKQQSGSIINLGSIAAELGLPDRFAYSMSKGAVVNMTYTVARDYIKDGIRCNSIGPARIHTPFVDGFLKNNYPGREKEMYDQLSATQPIGRMGQPIEVAYLVQYLSSDAAGFITGTNFPIDGGFIKLNT
jgi:NAD(P)-dependent dehydrogenase (short-subunit alcohol dehydrogenase family)